MTLNLSAGGTLGVECIPDGYGDGEYALVFNAEAREIGVPFDWTEPYKEWME